METEFKEKGVTSVKTTPKGDVSQRKKKSSGQSTKLEILQDFDAITDDDLEEADEDGRLCEGETLGEISKDQSDLHPTNGEITTETIEVGKDELPVKLPADITVVKEVVVVKRGRGRPRKNPLPQQTPTPSSPKRTATRAPVPKPLPDGPLYCCSFCSRAFKSRFGCKIHENACKRHKAQSNESRNSDNSPRRQKKSLREQVRVKEECPTEAPTPGKRKRGRPPKTTRVSSPPPPTMFKCDHCPKFFNTLPGLKRHENACRRINGATAEDRDGYQPNMPIYIKTLNNLNQALEGNLSGETASIEAVDVKDPYVFQEGRCHCCGEDIETAHIGGEFECSDCKKFFRLKSSLERHRRVVHQEGDSYVCPECDARCPDKGTLARHMYTHTGLKPVSCPVCKTEFSRKYHLIRHNFQTGCDGTKRPTFPCQVCGRVFNRKDNLREHLRAHAGQTKRKKRYNCPECGKEFVGASVLAMHKRTHYASILDGDKPFGCEFCPKRFPSKGAVEKHRRKHTGERPYECTFCYARFAAKETLNRHVRTHTGVKPHTCQYCGKGFIQASQLRAHVFHHSGVTAAGEGGHTCQQCGKSFNRAQRLALHIKYVHEGAEPYRCEHCTRTFLRKEDLARHQLLHSGIKEHKCPICEKCFAMKSSLKIHLLTHTKEPPRSCDECGRAFIRQDCLLRHMRTKHRDMLDEIMAEAEKKKLQQQLLAAANQAALQLPDEEPHVLSEDGLTESVRELLTLLVDETTLKAFGWPDSSVDKLLEAVIRRCGHQPAGFPDMAYADRLRENAKLLFTVVIDDSAVKTLLNNQTVDEVILHVLRLSKS